jgi:hypothetical protein
MTQKEHNDTLALVIVGLTLFVWIAVRLLV